jgi:hypothetical protein
LIWLTSGVDWYVSAFRPVQHRSGHVRNVRRVSKCQIGATCCEQVSDLASPYSDERYWFPISCIILNIGRYIATMMMPTMNPTPIIMSGSMIEVRDWIVLSTSSS